MRKRAFAVVLIGTAVLVTLAVASRPASATAGTMTVVVDTVLTEDHNGVIVIDADGVTLDCDGHTIQGPGTNTAPDFDGTGVEVVGQDSVTVKDCNVRDHHWGILLQGTTSSRVEGSSISDNTQYGILLTQSSSDNSIVGNQLLNNSGSMRTDSVSKP